MLLEESLIAYARGLDGVEEQERQEDDRTLLLFYREEKMVLAIWRGTAPLRVELRCDAKLAQTLMERYESVMQSRLLGQNGIEIICSGQLSDAEIKDLVRHSYERSR